MAYEINQTLAAWLAPFSKLSVDQNVVLDSLFTLDILLTLTVITIPIFLFYYGFIRPMNVNMSLEDIGFDYLKDGSHKTAENLFYTKRDLARMTLHRRAVGNLPPIYPNGWFVILESENLKKNEVKHAYALGENFAVFRSSEGKVYVLDAYCPHLGANMAIGGSVHGNCLECPFHKWQFSGEDGACTKISYSSSCPSSARVKTWRSDEKNGFIFVWYHAEGEEPSWEIEQSKETANGAWCYHGRYEAVVAGHVQDINENGADIGHLNALHGASVLKGSDLRNCEQASVEFVRHAWTASWEQHPSEPHVGLGSVRSDFMLLEKWKVATLEVNVLQLGPGYVQLRYQSFCGPGLLEFGMTPIGPLLTRFVQRVYAPFVQGPIARIFLSMETVMVSRDVMVWNHKKYGTKPLFIKEDSTLVRHRRWYQQFYSENSPQFKFQKDSFDW